MLTIAEFLKEQKIPFKKIDDHDIIILNVTPISFSMFGDIITFYVTVKDENGITRNITIRKMYDVIKVETNQGEMIYYGNIMLNSYNELEFQENIIDPKFIIQ